MTANRSVFEGRAVAGFGAKAAAVRTATFRRPVEIPGGALHQYSVKRLAVVSEVAEGMQHRLGAGRRDLEDLATAFPSLGCLAHIQFVIVVLLEPRGSYQLDPGAM
jgi:hypothetical protein